MFPRIIHSRLPFYPLLLAGCCTGLASVLQAQATSRVIPAHRATTAGNAMVFEPFGYDAMRMQQLIEGASVCSTSATIDEVAFRVASDLHPYWTFVGRTVPNISVWLGSSPATQQTMSLTFASNRGPRTLVHTGRLNLPTVPAGPVPANWDIRIKFLRKVAYARSLGNLLLEIEAPGIKSNDFVYYLDGDTGTGGKVRDFGTGGLFRQGPAPAIGSYEVGLRLGGLATIAMTVQGIRNNQVPGTLIALGVSDKRYGSLKLPFDLTPLGAKNNHLYVSLDVLLPIQLRQLPVVWTIYFGSIAFRVPNSPSIAGLRFFSQGLVLDPPSNALGLVTTNALDLTITKGVPAETKMLRALDSSASAGKFGTDDNGFGGPILRLSGTFR